MNIKLTLKTIGQVLLVESALMLIPLAVALLCGGGDAVPILISLVITAAAGELLSLLKPRSDNLRAREGFAVVALGWILVSFFGCLPFRLHGCIPKLVDAYFETVSGFTTTGATLLTDVEVLPKGLLFWRSFSHWVGGMGVLVLSLALLPKMGARSIHLMRAEAPGPAVDKLVPRVGNNAKILYYLYISLTAAMLVCLLLTGMNLYDALIHTFGAAGTGGFSNYNASVGAFDSPAAEIITGVFMALFGVNFSIYYYILRRNWGAVKHNSELWTYLSMMLVSSVVIAVNILPMYGHNFFTSLRYSFFQVSSIMTTTGYATADFDLWPQLSRTLLTALMLVGASAGSTGGGLKVVRMQLLVKSGIREIRHTVHPKSVITIRLAGRTVSDRALNGVQSFFFMSILVLIVSVLLISFDGYDLETNLTAVLSALSNIGPGFNLVGPTRNFSIFSDFSTFVLSMDMLIGRLEIFPMLMLAAPSAWRQY